MKILIVALIIIQVLIDIWCIAGILNNTETEKIILKIIDLVKEQLELKMENK